MAGTMIDLRKFSVDDYHKMAEAGLFAENERVELLEGRIYAVTPVGRRHAAIVAKLIAFFAPLEERTVVWVQNPLQLPPYGEPEPDVALLRFRETFYEDEVPKPGDVLLVIEVSDSTLRFDRHVKLPIYAEAGVPEFWIVDLVHNRTEVYREPAGGDYNLRDLVPFGTPLSPYQFPDISLTL